MCAVRSNRKLELEQKLVCRRAVRVIGPAVLTAHLAEFARPVGHHHRLTGVEQRRVVGSIGGGGPSSGEPSTRELIVPGDVIPHAVLLPIRLIATAPDDLAS